MMKTAYLDCFSGISGDMFLAALLDAGLPFEDLEAALRALPIDGYELQVTREERNQIFGTRFVVRTHKNKQIQRNLVSIRDIVQRGRLSREVEKKSIEVFEELAKAEGQIHGIPYQDVHFHELGAVDSIIDIVGTVYGVHRLEIGSIHVSPLPLGSGFVETTHGRLPIPAPATIALLKDVPVFQSGLPYEMVTPTGSALVKALGKDFGSMPPMKVQQVGYGVGKMKFPDRPNLLRILMGGRQPTANTETVVVLETNLDDTHPEWLSYVMERLFEAGALDVVFCPVQMKKNRPGVQMQVLALPHQKDALMEIIFQEITTLGIRFRYNLRTVKDRSYREVESPWGKIRVKEIQGAQGSALFLPEYEVCREIAIKAKRPLREIYQWVISLNRRK